MVDGAHHEAFIMNAGERSAENLVGAKQMIDVSARMMLASITVALSVDRREVLAKASITDVDAAIKGIQSAVAGLAGRRDTIESIDAIFDAKKQIGRLRT